MFFFPQYLAILLLVFNINIAEKEVIEVVILIKHQENKLKKMNIEVTKPTEEEGIIE